nr:cryptochrome/photolyase family protein [Oceanobacter mangrovi]
MVLGDQLSSQLASLRVLAKQTDLILLAEVRDEASYVRHHQQKIAFIFSAMRHFACQLQQSGWRVQYHHYDSQSNCQSLLEVVQQAMQQSGASELVLTQCGEYRLQQAMDNQWSAQLGIPVQVYADDRFVCDSTEFGRWAEGKKQLRMEYFYREMRRKTGLLMEGEQPVGSKWNFDAANRQRYDGQPPLPAPLTFQRDEIDREVLTLVKQEFADHPGNLDDFRWGTTRAQARQALEHFLQQRLPYFGDYQDAMSSGADFMFHSLLSPYLNVGLLTALEVCEAAEQAWRSGAAPLNAVEGFIRQIIGWREYVRGIYWRHMPDYAEQNRLGNVRDLPRYYWDGQTGMKCMSEAFRNTFEHAYAHHIQRLMVTGNFALLAGVKPKQICDWYLAVYADAFDWVELPNTLGMVMHADGGYLGSKPYAASGNYIHKMSDYCSGCRYNVKTASDHDSCPFNSLYWHFIMRHKELFQGNHRMSMIYRNLEKQKDDRKQALWDRAEWLLAHLDEL